jgi:rRNA maturation protein Nop10
MKPGEYMDGNVLKRRCPSCGAYLIKGRCPVSRKDCGR